MNHRGATLPPRPQPGLLAGSALLLLSLAALLPTGAGAQVTAGSAEAGAAKAVTCAACHGADGNSPNPEWPSLAGQHASYIAKSLRDYKDGTRADVLMTSQAQPLSEEDILDLAAYYSSQALNPKTAASEQVAAGERLYRGGDKDSGTTACIACHGPTGQGNMPAAWPAISGQHAVYTAKQLRLYRSRDRRSDGDTQMMRNVAATLSDDDINALASYIQGLR